MDGLQVVTELFRVCFTDLPYLNYNIVHVQSPSWASNWSGVQIAGGS
jgi:hypothetical protein